MSPSCCRPTVAWAPAAGRGGHRHPGAGAARDRLVRRESGLVTIELAFGMIVFALLLLLTLTAIATGLDHIRVSEASRVGARLAARSEPVSHVIAAAKDQAPDGSVVSVTGDGGSVVVTVRAPERAPFARLGWDVAAVARSVAPRELRP